jgi:regulator of cell morphogenesis and NO signaling
MQHELISEIEKKQLPEIADYIVGYYHERLRTLLPDLIFMADKVEQVHAGHELCPKGLTNKLREINNELLDHMMKEEQILFPLIKNGQGKHAGMPIKVMLHEHVLHAENLGQLRGLAQNFVAPEGACGTWRRLYQGLDQLDQELNEHINLENTVLFTRALET